MSILIERQRNRIHLFSPYDPDLVAKCKQVPGCGRTKFKDGRHRSWTFPLNWSVCEQLRELFGSEMHVGPALAVWARVERRRRRTARRLARSKAVDLVKVAATAPALAAAMGNRKYQQVGSAFGAHTGAALIADEPGLGKTLQAMGAVIEAECFGPILVLAPQTALETTWAEELARWLPQDSAYALVGDKDKRMRLLRTAFNDAKIRGGRVWVLANYEMLRIQGQPIKDPKDDRIVGHKPQPYPELTDTLWSAIIVDESQRLLITPYSEIRKQSLQRAGASLLQTERRGIKLALSGTPNRGKVENLWGTLNWLAPDKYKSYNQWLDKWFIYYTDNATGESIIDGAIIPSMEKKFYRDIDSYVIRRTKREVAPDMPPKMYMGWPLNPQDARSPVGVWLPMHGKQAKQYEQMRLQALVELETGELMANGVLAELTRLEQFAASCMELDEDGSVWPCFPSNKWDWLIPWLAERGIEKGGTPIGGKIIVASPSARLLHLYEEGLEHIGIKHCIITGANPKERKQQRLDFQSTKRGAPHLMLLSTKAGGVSLTLDQADDVVHLGETYDPDDSTQVEDRADRVSRSNHQVSVTYVRTLNTLEEAKAADNENMDRANHGVMDGRRGVKRARDLVAYRSQRKLTVKK